MPSHQSLLCHAATPSDAIRCAEVTVERSPDGGELNIRYAVHGEISRLAVPDVGLPARRDRLWEHTCFEMFVAIPGVRGYREFNFSPSAAWACYQFTGYRQGMHAPPCPSPPRIMVNSSSERLHIEIRLQDFSPGGESAALRLGLCAVLEEHTGTKSYWALQHSTSEPDFHDPSGFVWLLDRVGLRSAEPAGQQCKALTSAVVRGRNSA